MMTKQIDTETEYIPPRRLWKSILLTGGNAFTAWIILYFGSRYPVLWLRVLILLLGLLLALLTAEGIYRIFFYKPPYKLNVNGIFMQGIGLVPWEAIGQITYIDSVGYRRLMHSYSVRFKLKDLSFLEKSEISPMRKRRIEKKRYLHIAPDGAEEVGIVESWAAVHCRNRENTKNIVISIWGKKESESVPIYLPRNRNCKNKYDYGRYTVCGIPVADPKCKLREEPTELVPQMNAVIERIVNILAEEDYDALRDVFFDRSRVDPDMIRREIEKKKAGGRFTGISGYSKNARAKIIAAGAQCFDYYYELTPPDSECSLALLVIFRIGRESGKLQALWSGEVMLMPCENFPEQQFFK